MRQASAKGDILYKVEDLYVNSSTINDAVDIMRGTPGTDVHVTFLRGTEEMGVHAHAREH